jgi:RNA polymerase sigma-70 factor (ECF subfamily)
LETRNTIDSTSFWMMQDDQELLARALAGEQGVFTALYNQRQGAVYRFALHMTGSVTIAEDVTQETFLALFTQGARYDSSRGTLGAFLYGIARNLVMRRLDRGRDVPLEESAGAEDLLDDLTRRETIEHVRRAVLSLPPVYREAVVLCDLGDASYEEAAVALECPLGTVRSRLSRARTMLAQKLSGVRGTCNV